MSDEEKVIISDLVERGGGPDDIFFKLVQKEVYFIDDEGQIVSHYGRGKPLGGKGGTPRGPLYVAAGNPPVKIPAPRLAWMIHTRQRIPKDSSVIQLGDRDDYSWNNLTLVARGQESRFAKRIRDTKE